MHALTPLFFHEQGRAVPSRLILNRPRKPHMKNECRYSRLLHAARVGIAISEYPSSLPLTVCIIVPLTNRHTVELASKMSERHYSVVYLVVVSGTRST